MIVTPDPQQPDPLDGIVETLDRAAAAITAKATSGLSPATLLMATTDWAVHLFRSPGKQLQLGVKSARKYMRLFDYMTRSAQRSDACSATITVSGRRQL